MDYQSYDDYMRSVMGMGYQNMNNMNCCNMNSSNMCMNQATPYQNMSMNQMNQMNQSCDYLERMYPDTYHIIHPMVVTACNMVTGPVSEEMLDNMTNDIYDRAEKDSRISIDINIGVEIRENENSKQLSEDSRQRPRRRNRFLRDLIRILLIRELLNRRRPGFPMRPF